MAVVRIDGIEPHLPMLGDYQRFAFSNDPIVKLQQFSAYAPESGINTENNIELRNSRLSGFRFHQLSTVGDSFSPGTFKFQHFTADGVGNDIFTYDGAALTFNTPIDLGSIFISPDYTPPSNTYQSFIFPDDEAAFTLKNSFNYTSSVSDMRLNFLNYADYGFRFNHVNTSSNTPYGTMHFQLVNSSGIATELFYIDSTKFTFNTPIDMNSKQITNLPTPTLASEPATKSYVDGLVGIIPNTYIVPGSVQSFNFSAAQATSSFRLSNNYVYTGSISSSLTFDMINYQAYGYQLSHSTITANAPYGIFRLSSRNPGGTTNTLVSVVSDSVTLSVPLLMGNQSLLNTSKIGIGTSTVNGQLQFDNTFNNRKIVLNELNNNNFEFQGFGTTASYLTYNVDATTSDHVWYAATSSSARSELFRIKGTGDVIVPDAGTLYARSSFGSMNLTSVLITTITSAVNTKVLGTTTIHPTCRNFTMPSSNRLVYTGLQNLNGAIIVVSGNFTCNQVGSTASFLIYKNGVAITSVVSMVTVAGEMGYFLSVPVDLVNGDYLELWCRGTVTGSITVKTMYFNVS